MATKLKFEMTAGCNYPLMNKCRQINLPHGRLVELHSADVVLPTCDSNALDAAFRQPHFLVLDMVTDFCVLPTDLRASTMDLRQSRFGKYFLK